MTRTASADDSHRATPSRCVASPISRSSAIRNRLAGDGESGASDLHLPISIFIIPNRMPSSALLPDLIVRARRIQVLGDRAPVEALLVRGGRIAAAGGFDEVRGMAMAGARVEDLRDAVVTPGLVDAHVHLTTYGLSLRRVDLNAAPTLRDALEMIGRAASGGDGWVRGIGWDVHRWGRLPNAEELDAVCPDRPCYFQSHDIHGAWLNSRAMEMCGITGDTADPEGGRIVRDHGGLPTGVLLEKAMTLAERHLPPESLPERRDALREAQRELPGWALTGVHPVEVRGLEDFPARAEDGALRLRVLQAIQLARLSAAIETGVRSGFGGEWLRIGGGKMFLDGALGPRPPGGRGADVGSGGGGGRTP